MNTNEASLGRSTVQTYSTTEKSDVERAVFALECTARWLGNGSDPAQAAEQIRLAIAQIKGFIADCDVRQADARQPAAIDKEAVTLDQVKALESAVCNGQSGEALRLLHHMRNALAAPLDKESSKPAAPSVAQGEQADFEAWLKKPHSNNWNDCNHPLTVGERVAAHRAWMARAASTPANVAQCANCGMAVDPKCGCSLGRAASANVAQGAEAIYQLRLGNGSWQDTDERAYRYNIEHCPEDTRIVYAAPPAQTTLTTEQITDIRRAAVLIRENSYPCPDKPHSNWALADRIEKVIAALTAAQSGADRE